MEGEASHRKDIAPVFEGVAQRSAESSHESSEQFSNVRPVFDQNEGRARSVERHRDVPSTPYKELDFLE